MTKTKSTKRALLMSALALLMCVSMLIGSTFAWFTDSVTSSVNTIQAGTLQVDLIDAAGASLEGKSLKFEDKDSSTLWEPGCTYKLQPVRVKNAGTLALNYKLVINGLTGDAELLKAIEWTVTLGGKAASLTGFEGTLLAGETSEELVITGHMKEDAGNDYQGLSIDNISITVSATQATVESDSFNNQYDAGAGALSVSTFEQLQSVLNAGGYAKLTADIDASTLTPKNQALKVPAGVSAIIDLNGHTLTSKDGGSGNWMAIYVDQGADLTVKDSVGTGEIVSSCYGVYVKQNAKFIMDSGKLTVSGNDAYDMGVVLYSGSFVMNGGTIDAKIGVCASNYYKNSDNTLPVNSITIAKDAVINASTQDINLCEGESDAAPDTVIVDNRTTN